MEMGVSNECGDGDQLSAICYQKGCFEKKKKFSLYFMEQKHSGWKQLKPQYVWSDEETKAFLVLIRKNINGISARKTAQNISFCEDLGSEMLAEGFNKPQPFVFF